MLKRLLKTLCIVTITSIFRGGGLFGELGTQGSTIVYAQDGNSSTPDSQAVSGEDEGGLLETADLLMRFLSWAWIVPASIAGELMTNKVIYGEAFYLSEVLFKFWQFIRTLSLFALGFLMVYKVGESYVKGGDVSSLGSTAVKGLIAGALIPMSRWLVAATVDISLIATAAVSSLPLNAMEQLWTELKLDGKISCSKTVYVKDFQIQPDTDQVNNTQQLTFTDLVPAGDSVAGSMVFLGCGLLRMDQSLHLVNQENDGTKTADQISATFIRILMVLMLVIPMFVLVVVNIVRIVFIWLWIITVPFIILAYTFDLGKIKEMEYFKIGNIIGLIFQPVVVVGTLSVGVLILMGMYGALLGDEQTINQGMGDMINVYVDSDKAARIGTDGPAETIINGDIFGKTADILGGGIGRMIITFFMVFLFWALIKIGFTTSALTKGVSDSIFKFTEQMASTVPLVPVPGLGMQSVSSIGKAKQDIQRNNPYQRKINYEGQAIAERINQSLPGVTSPEFREEDLDEVKRLAYAGGSGIWKYIKDQQITQKKSIPLGTPLKTSIAEWVMKDPVTARKILGQSAIPSNTSVANIMKLWDPKNDDEMPGKLFRKGIHGILRNRIDPNSIDEKTLQQAAINGTGGELLSTYAAL